MAEPLRFGLIGAGGIAHTYVQAFPEIKEGRIVAVADVRPEVASSVAEAMHCAARSSHREMLDKDKIDAAIVCTPPASHPEICIDLMNAGVHVLCEKPISIDSASAQRMIDVSKQKKRVLTMASKFRFVEDVVRAQSMVASGVLGQISLFENAFTSHVDMSKRWNSKREQSGGGVLIDNGTHSVDILRYFLGPLSHVQAVEAKRVQPIEVEDTVRIFVRSASGVIAGVDLSWSINKGLESFIDIYGTEGVIRIGWQQSVFRRTADRQWTVFGKGYDKMQAFRSKVVNFCNAVAGTEPLRVTVDDALASVRAIEAAYASLAANNWIAVRS